jgi:hypothetical protein
MGFNSVTNRAQQQTELIHDAFVRWKCCRLTLTRLNVITVRVKIKLTTRTLSEDFVARLVWETKYWEAIIVTGEKPPTRMLTRGLGLGRFPSKHVCGRLFTSLNHHHLVCQGRGFKSCSLVVWNVIGVGRANFSSIRAFEAVAMFVCQKVVIPS